MAIDLDHLAFGLTSAQPVIDALTRRCGATILFGQSTAGFRWVLLRMGDEHRGLNLELLEPWREAENGFLTHFLTRRGDGAHHMTFKTDNLAVVLDRLQRVGHQPVDISLSDPAWREAFLRPRDAHGTIVQICESNLPRPDLAELLPRARTEGPERLLEYARGRGRAEVWWNEARARASTSVALDRIVVSTRSLPDAARLFEGALAGHRIAGGPGWLELCWSGPVGLRLEECGDERRPGITRVDGSPPTPRAPQDLAGLPLVLM